MSRDSHRDLTIDDPVEEKYLARLSALVDGELESSELLATIDYLVHTPEAQELYRQMRALEGVLAASGDAPPSERPDPGAWKRLLSAVEAAADEDDEGHEADARPARDVVPLRRPRRRRRSAAQKVWLAAAAGIIGAVLGAASFQLWQQRASLPILSESDLLPASEITVGARAGKMTDSRFFALATEILEADERYRREMLQIMNAVEEQPMVEKTSGEDRPGEDSELGGEELGDSLESNYGESDPFSDRPRVQLW